VEGSCERGNESLGSIKWWEVLELSERLVASQEAINSIDLITYARSETHAVWHIDHELQLQVSFTWRLSVRITNSHVKVTV
jgi:hypothetical protein